MYIARKIILHKYGNFNTTNETKFSLMWVIYDRKPPKQHTIYYFEENDLCC